VSAASATAPFLATAAAFFLATAFCTWAAAARMAGTSRGGCAG
jgi:hypothetical protein